MPRNRRRFCARELSGENRKEQRDIGLDLTRSIIDLRSVFILRSSRRPELDEPGKNPTGINYNCRIAKRTTRSFNIGIFFVSSRLANMVQVHDRANGGANNDFINGNIKC